MFYNAGQAVRNRKGLTPAEFQAWAAVLPKVKQSSNTDVEGLVAAFAAAGDSVMSRI